VFLSKEEDTYIEYLNVKKVPILEYTNMKSGEVNYLEKLKIKKIKDRDLMEKGEKAFVSFVRAYKEHKCKYIFKSEKLDIDKLAIGYSLLKVFIFFYIKNLLKVFFYKKIY
jgi:ATP-dependent RNA helicase DDX55/SPB4